jgi:hypothetical protein
MGGLSPSSAGATPWPGLAEPRSCAGRSRRRRPRSDSIDQEKIRSNVQPALPRFVAMNEPLLPQPSASAKVRFLALRARSGGRSQRASSGSTPAVRRVGARFYTPSAGSTGANSNKLTSARGGRHLLRGFNRQKFGRTAHIGRVFGSARSSSTPRDDGGPRRKPFVGGLAAFTAALAAQASEGTARTCLTAS